jgi:DNA repair exonuclease SbcCD ATPase subunit
MRLVSLEMIDFMAYTEQQINFDENGCYIILGRNADRYGKSNGVGKSSIFIAIYAALYNQIRGKTLTQAIRAGAKGYKLTLVLQSADGYYQIIRSRRRDGTSTTFMFYDSTGKFEEDKRVDLTCHNQDDTQERINALLKMNAKSFSHSVYFKEDMASAFAKAKKGERFELIKNSLQIDQYDKIVKIAKADLDQVNATIKEISDYITLAEQSLINLETQTAEQKELELSIERAGLEIAQIESKLSEIISIKNSVADLEQLKKDCIKKKNLAISNLSDTENRLHELDKKIGEANAKIEQYRASLKKMNLQYKSLVNEKNGIIIMPEDEVAKINDDILACQVKIRQNLETIESAREMIAALSKAHGLNCPTCTSPLDAKKRKLLVDSANNSIDTAIASNDLLSQRVNSNSKTLNDNASKIDRLNSLNRQIDQLTFQANSMMKDGESLKSIIASLQPERDAAAQSVKEQTTQLEAIKMELAKIEKQISLKYDDEIEGKLINKKQSLLGYIATSNQRIGVIEETNKAIRESIKDLGVKQAELNALSFKRTIVENVIDSCSKKGGIPSILIGQALKEIEKYANQTLSSFDDYDALSIKFITSKPDEIEIMVRKDPEVEFREFDTFSGAERFIVSFAIRMAMSEILSHKYGSDLQFILLDEAGTALDDYNMGLFANILKRMASDKLVLCITHQKELQDHIPQTILVKRSGGKSEILVNNKEMREEA